MMGKVGSIFETQRLPATKCQAALVLLVPSLSQAPKTLLPTLPTMQLTSISSLNPPPMSFKFLMAVCNTGSLLKDL